MVFINATINHLPVEVIFGCFTYLPSTVLLDCRLVSKRFYGYASASCRNRNMTISSTKFYVNPKAVSNAFPDKANLPFSSLNIIITTGYMGSYINRQIADSYGEYISTLQIDSEAANYDNLIYVLSHTPNLRNLKVKVSHIDVYGGSPTVINPEDAEFRHFLFPAKGEILLPKLQTLAVMFKLAFSYIFLDFLEFILTKTESSVNSFAIETKCDEVQPFQKLLEITKPVPYVSLKLIYPSNPAPTRFWEQLSQHQNSNIRGLSIVINYSKLSVPNPSNFEPLEQFLEKCSALEELSLSWYCHDPPEMSDVNAFHLPPLQTLRVLDLEYDVYATPLGQEPQMQFQYVFHSEVKFPMRSGCISSQKFPLLQDLRLRATDRRDNIDFSHLFDFDQHGETEVAFRSVTKLLVESSKYNDNLTSKFPHLRVLELRVSTPSSLKKTFTSLNQITQMKIILNFSSYHDVNNTLSWILPSPITTTCLKRLIIFTSGTGIKNSISDTGAILFVLFPPLDLLRISGVANISSHCLEKLKAQHKIVQLL